MPEMLLPTRELAERLTSNLGYDGKIYVTEVNPASGCCDAYMYSLKEVANFLEADMRNLTEMCGFIRFVDPDDLREWVRTTLGDAELATALAEASREYEGCADSVERYIKKVAAIRPIKELLLLRLKQAEEVLGRVAVQGGKS